MEELRRLRKLRGLTQAKLAVQADLDPSSLSQIETGARHPTTRTLEKLAGVLGVEVRELFPLEQATLPLERARTLEGARALEASEEEFAEMVAEADDGELAAMKAALKEHLPEGGPLPLPTPTPNELLAVNRCVTIYREQKMRLDKDEAALNELEAALTA